MTTPPESRDVTNHPYGYCPKCGSPGEMRERRLNGNDICENRHTYPSRDALTSPPKLNRVDIATPSPTADETETGGCCPLCGSKEIQHTAGGHGITKLCTQCGEIIDNQWPYQFAANATIVSQRVEIAELTRTVETLKDERDSTHRYLGKLIVAAGIAGTGTDDALKAMNELRTDRDQLRERVQRLERMLRDIRQWNLCESTSDKFIAEIDAELDTKDPTNA